MKTKSPVWLILLFTFLMPASLAWAGTPKTKIDPLGDNTYCITVTATSKFTRNTTKLKDVGIVAATEFCTKQGKRFKLVSVDENKTMYIVGDLASTKVTFKALAAGDPELATVPGDTARPAVMPAPPVTADVLTSELTKLDELRKKGLLTDDEFTAAKKKLLDRM